MPGEFHAVLFEASGTRLLADAYPGVLATSLMAQHVAADLGVADETGE